MASPALIFLGLTFEENVLRMKLPGRSASVVDPWRFWLSERAATVIRTPLTALASVRGFAGTSGTGGEIVLDASGNQRRNAKEVAHLEILEVRDGTRLSGEIHLPHQSVRRRTRFHHAGIRFSVVSDNRNRRHEGGFPCRPTRARRCLGPAICSPQGQFHPVRPPGGLARA